MFVSNFWKTCSVVSLPLHVLCAGNAVSPWETCAQFGVPTARGIWLRWSTISCSFAGWPKRIVNFEKTNWETRTPKPDSERQTCKFEGQACPCVTTTTGDAKICDSLRWCAWCKGPSRNAYFLDRRQPTIFGFTQDAWFFGPVGQVSL